MIIIYLQFYYLLSIVIFTNNNTIAILTMSWLLRHTKIELDLKSEIFKVI